MTDLIRLLHLPIEPRALLLIGECALFAAVCFRLAWGRHGR